MKNISPPKYNKMKHDDFVTNIRMNRAGHMLQNADLNKQSLRDSNQFASSLMLREHESEDKS